MAPQLLKRVLAVVLAVPFLTSPLGADTDNPLYDAFVHIWHDQRRMLTSPLRVNQVDFLIWGTAAGSLVYLAPKWGNSRSADERFEQGLDRHNVPLGHFLHGLTHVGDSSVLFGATLTTYGVSRWQEWPRVQTASLHVFEGLMDAGIAAELIKIAAGRRRPVDRPSRGPFLGPSGWFRDYADNSSFLSGHAAMTFAAATIISHESRTYWVGIPAYMVASGISYSRIYVERHWLSDVVGGAVLGYSIGILVEHNRHSKPQLAGTFYPYVEQDALGVAWRRTF